jgi:hypothetical protein
MASSSGRADAEEAGAGESDMNMTLPCRIGQLRARGGGVLTDWMLE